MADRPMVVIGLAVVVVGIPVATVTHGILTGLTGFAGVAGLLALTVAIALGVHAADEVASIRLGGLEALRRGDDRAVLRRHLVLTIVAGGLLVAGLLAGARAASAGLTFQGALGGALIVASAVALARAGAALRSGYRGRTL